MNRRQFSKMGLGLGILQSNLSSLDATKKFNLNFAPHYGMFENLAGSDMIEQIKFCSEVGFTAFEDNGMMTKDPAFQRKIAQTLESKEMSLGVFILVFDDWPNNETLATGKKEHLDRFLKACSEAVEVAKRCNGKYMTVVPGNYSRNLPIGIQTANVIEALRYGAEIFEPHDLVMSLEFSSDSPDLFLQSASQTFAICKAVNSPSCKILFDIWHQQRNEGRIMYNIDQCWDQICYFQTGDEPGRFEPGTGELNYKNILQHIHTKSLKDNRSFIFGMEHYNSTKGRAGELKVIESYRECDI
jgi:hydroxypyruvate isomerase